MKIKVTLEEGPDSIGKAKTEGRDHTVYQMETLEKIQAYQGTHKTKVSLRV